MIIRQQHRPQFTRVDNRTLRDENLSFRAVGMLAFLLSMPDVWSTNYRHLASVHTEGEHAVRETLKELERAGYLRRQRVHLGSGKFDWEVRIYERPIRKAPVGNLVDDDVDI